MAQGRRFITLLLGGTAFFFVFSFSLFLFSFPPHIATAESLAPSTPAVATADTPALEVHIANNGLVLLRNVRVTTVNESTLTVSALWGSTDFKWTVRTNASSYETRSFGTRFLSRDGKSISLRDVRVGNLVTITGMLDNSEKEPTIDADTVRSVK